MTNILKTQKLNKAGFFQRLFGIEPKENALIEVNNLLSSRPMSDIKPAEIEAISNKYKIDLHKRFSDRFKEIYREYLQQNYSDHVITDQEVIDQNYLKELLKLNDSEVEEIHNELAGKIYKESYNDVISDGKIEPTEKEYLEKLQKDLRLSNISEETISNESTQEFMQMHIEKIIEDGKISPEEWEKFVIIASNLDVDVNWNKESTAMVEKLKLYWLIEHEDLPVKETTMDLQENESCYFSSDAEWLEDQTTTNDKKNEEPVSPVKIKKGEFYRAGTLDIQSINPGELQLIESGQVFLTNQRIIFTGTKKNSDIKLKEILSINPFKDGVEIEKENGKSPVFRLNDADLFTMTLTRAIMNT